MKEGEVPCPNGCGARMRTARGLHIHLKKKCRFREKKTAKNKGGTRKFKLRKRDMD